MGTFNIWHLLGLYRHNQKSSIITASNLGLDPEFSYFILQASFGDKWYILSYFPELLHFQKKVKIIASTSDKQLIRIFIGEEQLERSIIFWEASKIEELSSRMSPLSEETDQLWVDLNQLVQTNAVIEKGFPPNSVRHLHIVKYPYFSDLHLVHGVPYDTLLKMLLYLPGSSRPVQPIHYKPEDVEQANAILAPFRNHGPCKIVIFNVVNISHLPLSFEQIELIIKEFEQYEIRVLLNLTGHSDGQNLKDLLSDFKWADFILIPGHLMAMIFEQVNGVFGVMGGAMTVSVYFSRCHVLSLHSDAVGFNLTTSNVYAGKYADNLWKIEEETRPFLFEGRSVENIEVGNPKDIDINYLKQIVSCFANEI